MAKIKFIGVPGEKHDDITMYGKTFPLGETVDAADLPAAHLATLKNHPHFEHVEEPAEDHLESHANADRSALVHKAEAIGVKVDGRWSDERITAEITKAEGKKAK